MKDVKITIWLKGIDGYISRIEGIGSIEHYNNGSWVKINLENGYVLTDFSNVTIIVKDLEKSL